MTAAARTVRPEDERFGAGATLLHGSQHVLSMYGGVIAPPIVVGQAAGLDAAEIGVLVSAALLVSGLATILQTLGIWRVGARLPLVQGTSFAAVSTMATIAAGEGGLPAVAGAVMVAGAVGVVLAPLFGRLVRLFPPVVTGSIIAVIGLSLIPVAVRWMATPVPGAGAGTGVALAVLTLLAVVVLTRFGPPATRRVAVLLGLVIGTLLAAAIGVLDLSPVADGPVAALPQPFAFGAPVLDAGAVLAMVVVVVVIMSETTADLVAVGQIVGTRVDGARVADGLRADMAATALAPVLNSFPTSAFAQNVGLVALTGIRSRYVVAAGGAVLVVLGLLPSLGRLVAAVPMPVLGGAGLVLFGSVAAAGARTIGAHGHGPHDLTVVAVALGAGMIPIADPGFWEFLPPAPATVLSSGISAGAIAAVTLNLLINRRRDHHTIPPEDRRG